jgi:hypothetical protein
MTAIISLDCEANGLHGQIFAFAATIHEDGEEVLDWQARCPIFGPVDPWVAENVLPALANMPETGSHYSDLIGEWRSLYEARDRESTLVIAHVAWPIEARFLWDAHSAMPFSGPFPLIDVASMLHQAGEDPTSVDDYLVKRSIPLPTGTAHHPLYDCRAAALAYFELATHDRSCADSRAETTPPAR